MRKLQEPGIVVVDNLKPSDKGKHLVTAVEEKIGYLPSGCEFMSGSKKVWLAVHVFHRSVFLFSNSVRFNLNCCCFAV